LFLLSLPLVCHLDTVTPIGVGEGKKFEKRENKCIQISDAPCKQLQQYSTKRARKFGMIVVSKDRVWTIYKVQ
jgi:hypothetical protein